MHKTIFMAHKTLTKFQISFKVQFSLHNYGCVILLVYRIFRIGNQGHITHNVHYLK